MPELLKPLMLQNQQLMHGLLFRAVSQTLLEIAADPRRLGAQVGFLAVLHTWSQRLEAHPHIHCLVPAGGIAPDGSRWMPCRPKFFLPVKVLSKMFRGKFLALLRDAFADGARVGTRPSNSGFSSTKTSPLIKSILHDRDAADQQCWATTPTDSASMPRVCLCQLDTLDEPSSPWCKSVFGKTGTQNQRVAAWFLRDFALAPRAASVLSQKYIK